MSIKVMSMVFDRYPGSGSEMLLALALVDYAHDDGTSIWPSLAELARKTRQSRRTVQRQIAKMVESGWLEEVRAATGRPGYTNEYRICAAWIAGAALPSRDPGKPPEMPSAGTETGDKTTPVSGSEVVHTGDKVTPVENGERGVTRDERGVTGDARGDTAMSPESPRTIKNHTPLPPDGGAAGFDVVFAEYPNHANRSKAERRWIRLAPTAEQQRRMLAAIAQQRVSAKWSKDDGRFVPEFVTWLRNAGWRDGVATVAGKAWDHSRSSIEAKAREFGIAPWDEATMMYGGESFLCYTSRVRALVEAEQQEVACA